VHGFYATMGGFAFTVDDDLTDDFKDFFPDGQTCVNCTASGVQFLMEHCPDLISDLSLTDITDRAGSSSLGKTLLIVQVVWFCLNCASRLREHLPLSLLEVSTLAHGLCTLASYALWWSKPQNINAPTWIPDGGSEQLQLARKALVFMLMSHHSIRSDSSYFSAFKLSQASIAKFELASKVATDYAHIGPSFNDILYTNYPALLSFDSSPSFRCLLLGSGMKSLFQDVIFTTSVPIFYGMLHFLGWTTDFPTNTERSLWRIAILVIMSSGAALAVVNTVENTTKSTRILSAFYNAFYYLIVPFIYLLGSMYLLVESIRQLWYVAPKGYVVASWSYYFPHPF